ncbi:MAG: cellulose biosynthesis cyclic di-GMP-binding regulatory protein BcsB, partial [Deltaproteobacteria bacterium]|nr:cellulose biosynthesis cyclic di-GMP-binding regulatory protein BcsB [Deltaproteobacteria bacterium]
CDDVHNPALWSIFEKESSLTVHYEEIDVVPDLALFPESYSNPDLIYGKPEEKVHAVFLLPHNPSQVVLDSAAVLGAVLGDYININSGYFKATASAETVKKYGRSNIIVIGNHEFVKHLSGTGLQNSLNLDLYADDKNGRVFELQSPLNPKRRMLVITGKDDEAINIVKENLKRPTRLIGLKGDSVVFSGVPLGPLQPAIKSEAVFAIRLKDLKMSDQIARGKFYHSINFTIPNPFVGRIKDGAFLRLNMSHSELLLPQTSSLLIKVNGQAVKSIRLTPETATRQDWDVLIPVVYLNSRFLIFELEVFMDIGDPDCMFNHPEMAWFTLHNDTLLYLPIVATTPVTLSNYPHIFLQWNRLENLALLIDPEMFETSMTTAVNICAYLSHNLLTADLLAPSIKTLDAVGEATLKDENIVAVAAVDRLMSDKNFGA